jgi:hypothetical protein
MMTDFGYAEILEAHEYRTACTFNGGTYYGVIGAPTTSKDLGMGGFSGMADQTFVCPTAQFNGTPPEESNTLVIDGTTYRVASKQVAPGGSFMVLALVNSARGL